jgi:hypothetical protein
MVACTGKNGMIEAAAYKNNLLQAPPIPHSAQKVLCDSVRGVKQADVEKNAIKTATF